MFLAAIRLQKTKPDVPRPYKVPGGKKGLLFFAGLGITACVSAMIIGFIPPGQLAAGNLLLYELFLIVGLVAFLAFPFIVFHFRKPSWKSKIEVIE